MTTAIDHFVRWNLDPDGDLYGQDERERLRWYEGVAVAAQVQWILIPWVAAAGVWLAGGAVVVPLLAVIGALVVPMIFCTVYVQSRRVDTTPRSWSAKRLLITGLGTLPLVGFGIGVLYRLYGTDSSTWQGAIVGAVAGGGLAAAVAIRRTRKRRRADAAAALADD